MIKIIIDLLILIPVFIYVVFKQFTCKHSWKELTEIYPNNSKAYTLTVGFRDSCLRVRFAIWGTILNTVLRIISVITASITKGIRLWFVINVVKLLPVKNCK